MIILDYIINNILLIKDLVNILFWIIASITAIITGVIAYKSYTNAKKSLFNPIRTEIVKYQIKNITEFIDKYSSNGQNFYLSADYPMLIKLNIDLNYLISIGLNKENYDEYQKLLFDYCNDNLKNIFEVYEKDTLLNLKFVEGDLDILDKYLKTKTIKEKEIDNSNVPIQRIFLNRNFSNFYNDLKNLKINPFIPKELKDDIEIIISNIHHNIGCLYNILFKNLNNTESYRYQDIIRKFEKHMIDHKEDLNNLNNSINKYFKVDKI
ncbi:hypothetical protein OBK16_11890 [Empedobacter falsenii]